MRNSTTKTKRDPSARILKVELLFRVLTQLDNRQKLSRARAMKRVASAMTFRKANDSFRAYRTGTDLLVVTSCDSTTDKTSK